MVGLCVLRASEAEVGMLADKRSLQARVPRTHRGPFPSNCLQGNICCGCQLHICTAQGRRMMGRPRAWEGKGRGHSGAGPWVPAAPQEAPAVTKTIRPEVTRCCSPATHREGV